MTSFMDESGRVIGEPRPRVAEEVWTNQTDSAVWVEVTDHKGAPRSRSVSGKGQILRITADDRLLCQEKVLDPRNDPFVNGTLLRKDMEQGSNPQTRSANALSDADLAAAFELDDADFEDFLRETSEVNARRLKVMIPVVNAGARHVDILNRMLEELYAVGGTTPSNEEARSVRQ